MSHYRHTPIGSTTTENGIIVTAMTRLRIIIFFVTILVVSTVGFFALAYARGYRLNQKTLEFGPHGLLVANSDPNGASVFIDGELKTATNATIPLPPGTYDVSVRKESFISWSKRITISKEEVTQINVSLFASAPSLSAVTFSGSINPNVSPDSTKILYGVPQNGDAEDKAGLWILETVNLPLGFNREPRRITDGNLVDATWEWSPDSREVLLTTKTGMFLLQTSDFTPQTQRVNVSSQKQAIDLKWTQDAQKRLEAQLAKLPDELEDVFLFRTTDVVFSPDENKILYTASGSASLKEGLIKPLPGSSTQKQVRDIKDGKKYVFDIKEDRNFEIADKTQPVYWFPTSLHVVLPEENKISVMEYDGTNKQTVFTGSYVFPFAYPTTNANRLLIITNFGADSALSNLYSLSLK